jgi:hypothetical protein
MDACEWIADRPGDVDGYTEVIAVLLPFPQPS